MGPPDLYYSGDVTVRLDALDEVLAMEGRVDVLFVGSSVVRANIRPLEFDRTLAEAGFDVVSFNGGLSAAWPGTVRLYVDGLWLEEVNPGVVVQAIRFEELVNASLSQQAGGGIEGRYESLWRNESAASTIGELVLDSSRLAQYSGWLTTLLADSESPLAGTVRFVIDDRGYAATRGTLTQRIADAADIVDIPGGSAAKNGFVQTFEPSTFSVGLAMLADTIDATRASGSEFVLFNMPEHGDKFLSREDGAARYESYVEALRNLAAEKGIVFVDFTNADASIYAADEPFADFHHMTPDGAKELTRRLADEFISGSLRGLLGANGA